MPKECNVKQNKEKCNCTYGLCNRKGVCCECFSYHREMGELPACYFPEDVEKTYDRSIESFIATYQERGKWW